jgi:hypothetical protein
MLHGVVVDYTELHLFPRRQVYFSPSKDNIIFLESNFRRILSSESSKNEIEKSKKIIIDLLRNDNIVMSMKFLKDSYSGGCDIGDKISSDGMLLEEFVGYIEIVCEVIKLEQASQDVYSD